jgi:hypothetical protein
MNMPLTDGGTFAGIAPDHTAALLAPLFVPIIIWSALRLAGTTAAAGWGLARRFQLGYRASTGSLRLVAILLLLSGTIHLLLIPAHLAESPDTALLFALNGLAFGALSAAVFYWGHWRSAADLLLAATLLAYVVYLATGQEDIDLVGIATYLIELVTLGLVWLPGTPHRQAHRGREGQATGAARLLAR